MKRIQIGRNIVDETLLKEVKKYMIAPWQRNLLIIAGIIALIIGAFNLVNQQLLQGVILVILGGVCIGEIFFLKHSRYKEMLKLMDEEIDARQVTYTMIFGNDGVVVHNCQTAIDNKIPYSHLKSFYKTPNAYVLLAKGNELIIIRKECLKVTLANFVDFLKTKDTKIKQWIQD